MTGLLGRADVDVGVGNGSSRSHEQGVNNLRWKDHHATTIGEVSQNISGSFLRVEISLISSTDGPVKLCFSIGINGDGWIRATEGFESVTGVQGVQSFLVRSSHSPPPATMVRSFADAVRN